MSAVISVSDCLNRTAYMVLHDWWSKAQCGRSKVHHLIEAYHCTKDISNCTTLNTLFSPQMIALCLFTFGLSRVYGVRVLGREILRIVNQRAARKRGIHRPCPTFHHSSPSHLQSFGKILWKAARQQSLVYVYSALYPLIQRVPNTTNVKGQKFTLNCRYWLRHLGLASSRITAYTSKHVRLNKLIISRRSQMKEDTSHKPFLGLCHCNNISLVTDW